MRKVSLKISLLALIGVVGATASWASDPDSANSGLLWRTIGSGDAPKRVVSRILSSESIQQRRFSGSIAARNEFVLGFQTIGRIAELSVDVGDRVKKGDVIALLDQVSLQEQVDAAEASLSAEQAEADFYETQFERVRTLRQRNVSSQADEESALAQKDAALAQVEAAKADLNAANEALEYAKLIAPSDGIVIETPAEQGSVVVSGERVVTLASLSARDAVIDVPTEMLPAITPETVFHVALTGAELDPVEARLRLVEPVTDETLRNRRIRLALENPGPDYRINALVDVWPAAQGSDAILMIPNDAILDVEGTPAVWRVGPGRVVEKVDVTISVILRETVISDGVAEGDEIVVKGIHSLTEGQTVGARIE